MSPGEQGDALVGRDKPRAVFITDFVHLGVAFEELVSVILDPELAWLRRLDAGDEGAGGLPSQGPDAEGTASAVVRVGIGPLATQRVAMRAGPARRHGDSVIVPLSWEPEKFERLLPKLEADLEVSNLDGGYSRLSISGRYRVPLDGLGYNLDRVALHRVAEASLRRFLHDVELALTAGR